MDGGKKDYKQKRFLPWKHRDLLEIINGSKIITNENFPSFTEGFEHENVQLPQYALGGGSKH